MITKLMQDIEGEFEQRGFIKGVCDLYSQLNDKERKFLVYEYDSIKDFLHSAQTRLLEGIVKEIEGMKLEEYAKKDKIPYAAVYDQALSDIISKLKQE